MRKLPLFHLAAALIGALAATAHAASTPTTPMISGNGNLIIGANGERIPVEITASEPEAAAAQPAPGLDAATRAAAARERAKVARRGQVMHSITPRTNVDRTSQMPDDPPSPALTLPGEFPRPR